MKYNNLSELFAAIANAIRGKTGDSASIVAEDFPEAIEAITSGDTDGTSATDLAAFHHMLENKGTSYMFYQCREMTSAPLFDTSKVKDMKYMFYSCQKLPEVPLFDTSSVTNMCNMFYYCKSLTTIPAFDTRNVTDMNAFVGYSTLVSFPDIDTSSVTDTRYMFSNCTNLSEVPTFNMPKLTMANQMFTKCTSLKHVVFSDVSKLSDAESMFSGCSSLVSVSFLKGKELTKTGSMFYNCSALETVDGIDMRNVTSCTSMFSGCNKLKSCRIFNIDCSLTICASYNSIFLSQEELIHIIGELLSSSSSRTLTISATNIETISDVYVRPIAITDEMRAEDDLIDRKMPFELCSSEAEGAVLITNYALEKKWTIK